jgi:hypothetical protein
MKLIYNKRAYLLFLLFSSESVSIILVCLKLYLKLLRLICENIEITNRIFNYKIRDVLDKL